MSGSNLNHTSDVGSSFSDSGIDGTLGHNKSSGFDAAEYMTSMNRTNKSTIPAPSGPIIAGNCISCMGMVRISHSLSVNTTVRCPHCQESFVLAELLDQSLPPLEVVVNEPEFEQADSPYIDTIHLKRDEQASRPEKPRVKFEIPKALKDGAKRKRRRRRRRSSSSASGEGSSSSSKSSNFVIPSSSPSGGESTTMGEAVERRSRSGSRRSSSSKSGEGSSHRGKVRSHASRLKDSKAEWSTEDLLKIGAGCLLAIPIAYMMLIWVFKADPFGVASPMSKTVPFAIPSSMHAAKEVEFKSEAAVDLPSYLSNEDDVKPFVPEPITEGDDRIAIPDIDPNEVFGQEFGL